MVYFLLLIDLVVFYDMTGISDYDMTGNLPLTFRLSDCRLPGYKMTT